jgi:hypothetical protein
MNLFNSPFRYRRISGMRFNCDTLKGKLIDISFNSGKNEIICENTMIDYYDQFGRMKTDLAKNLRTGDLLIGYKNECI